MKSGLSDELSDIRKGKLVPVVGRVITLECKINAISIDPGHGCGHHTKVEMINDDMRVSGLAFSTPGFLLDFFETRFYFQRAA
jgi:hypothetical protein